MTDYSLTDEKSLFRWIKKSEVKTTLFFIFTIPRCHYFSTTYSFAYYKKRGFSILFLHRNQVKSEIVKTGKPNP
jgi:hypothetical protein